MPETLAELSRRYDGPIPPNELAAARHGYPRAGELLSLGADMSFLHARAKGWTRCIKKLGRSDVAFGRLLANARFDMGQWRKLREQRRKIIAETRALQADLDRGLHSAAAE